MDKMAVNLLVVGRDGNGKSSTCNSIFGEKYFIPSSTNLSAEFDCKEASLAVNGRDVTLTKISGLDYPNDDVTVNVKDYFDKIEAEVKASTNGFSAVIIVVKYGLRYTKQERDHILMIKSTFGSDVVRNYGVLVLTNGDNFAADNEEDGQTFEDWCQAQTGDFQALLNECSGRCVLFNNWTKDETTRNKQRENLFSMVANIQSKMKPYTFTDYEKAASSRTVVLVTCALPSLKEKTTAVLTEIGTQMRQLKQNESSPETKETLTKLQETLKDHRNYLENEDKNTQILNSLFLEMSLVEKGVAIKLQIAEQIALCEAEEWSMVDGDGNLYQSSAGQNKPRDNSNATSADPHGTGAHFSWNSGNVVPHLGNTKERDGNVARNWPLFQFLMRFWEGIRIRWEQIHNTAI